MIQGLFETHLFVKNLELSIDFYKNTLGLEQCYYEEARKTAFFWIGKPKEAMLGLWEDDTKAHVKQHLAFRCGVEDVLNHSVNYLKHKGLKPYNFLNDETQQPMVFAWMPAIAIYFNDPDEHILEFIAILEGEPKPELGVVSYDKWTKMNHENS